MIHLAYSVRLASFVRGINTTAKACSCLRYSCPVVCFDYVELSTLTHRWSQELRSVHSKCVSNMRSGCGGVIRSVSLWPSYEIKRNCKVGGRKRQHDYITVADDYQMGIAPLSFDTSAALKAQQLPLLSRFSSLCIPSTSTNRTYIRTSNYVLAK